MSYSQQSEQKYRDDMIFPTGKLGLVVSDFFNIINEYNENKVVDFLDNHCELDLKNRYPTKAFQEYFLNISKYTGGINFYSLREYNAPNPKESVIIFIDTNYELFQSLILTFSNERDYLISGFRFSEIEIPSNELKHRITEMKLTEISDDLFVRLCEKDMFSGTVLIAKGKRVIYENACGEASKRYHIQNNIDTKFNLGSMNKMFTTLAVMQLFEQDKLKLTDTISKYVDESWLPYEITSQISIHHLLTHTSGLGNYFNKTYRESSRELFRTVDDFKILVQSDSLVFKPGDKYMYSNTGMLLLGAVIQNITNQDYFDYIRKNIYERTGMTNTDAFEMDQPVENLAIGYIPNQSNKYGWENNLYKHVIKGGPAGGGFSTVKDLHKFALALINKKLVSKESLNLIWTDYTKSNYGYGFKIKEGLSGKIVGHGGGFPGLNSNLDIFIDSGFIIIVMSNYDSGARNAATKLKQMVEMIEN